jgi:hypothetical protein
MAGEEEELRNDEDQQPLTIGQLIAGIKQPSAMPRTAAPDSADTPAPQVRPQLDPNALPDFVRPPKVRPDEIPQPPTSDQNTSMVDLVRRQASLEKPINPLDPATHKIKPEYRMGTGARILGTVGNFLSGFGGSNREPTYVGPGATNWRFGREEEQRTKELGGVNEQLGTQEKLATENEKLYRDAMRGAYEGEVGEARLGTSRAQQETASVRQQLAGSQEELNRARANKADQAPEPKNEIEVATALQNAKASGDKAAIAKWKGVLDELRRQKAAGKDTSASDIAKSIQVAQFRGKEHDRIDQAKESERRNRYAELDRNLKLKYNEKAMAEERAKVDSELEGKYDPKHQSVDDQADKMLGLTKSGAPLKSNTGAPKSTAAKPAAKAPPKVGETILVNGKPHRVTGINAKTGKPQVVPITGQ